jgi:hypothetical protein
LRRWGFERLAGFLDDPYDVLYPPLFDGDDLKPGVADALRYYIIVPLSEDFNRPEDWLRFSLYGSGISYNWDERGDLDVQVWLDEEGFLTANPTYDPTKERPLSAVRKAIAPFNFVTLEDLGIRDGKMGVQYYVKLGRGTDQEIQAEHPYAAYNLDEERWVIHPVPFTPEFYAEHFERLSPKVRDIVVDIAEKMALLDADIASVDFWTAMSKRDDAYLEDAAHYRALAEEDFSELKRIYDSLMKARADAYRSSDGKGIYDDRDQQLKTLEMMGVWGKLKERIHDGLPWRSGAS